MNSFKVFTKEYSGHDCKKLRSGALLSVILFCSVYFSEIKLPIAPKIMHLMAFSFTAGIMLQTLSSNKNRESLSEIFTLPFSENKLKASFITAVSLYVALTKTLPLLALLSALGTPAVPEILMCAECIVTACLLTPALYLTFTGVFSDTAGLPVPAKAICSVLAAAAVIYGIFMTDDLSCACIMAVSMIVSAALIIKSDIYLFTVQSRGSARISKKRTRAGIMGYMARRMKANPSYLTNTVFLCAFACILPVFFRSMNMPVSVFIGPGILTLNTPLCTMLSSDPDTKTAVRTLPSQASGFRNRYCIFIFIFNLFIQLIYLCAVRVISGGIQPELIAASVLASLQGALLSAWLEWNFPVHGWKTEPDLWHHPRKYIVPSITFILVMAAGTVPAALYAWSAILVAELVIFFGAEKMPRNFIVKDYNDISFKNRSMK